MFYLGIDGGGTKTKSIVIDENNHIVYEGISGPSSVDTVSFETSYSNIEQSLVDFFKVFPTATFESAFIGLGGIVFEKQKETLKAFLKNLAGIVSKTHLYIENDMFNALFSSGSFDKGMSLICGTGMVAFGINEQGRTHKAAGWGYKEGEIGSGYSLGFSAIQYMIRAYDGRYKKDAFAKEIASQVNLKKATDIIYLLEEFHNNRTKVASLAPLVTKYANLNHPYALKIIDTATDEIALAVQAVFHELAFEHEVSLVIIGSLGLAPGVFHDKLIKKIKAISSFIHIKKAIYDPALGAALYAKYQSHFK